MQLNECDSKPFEMRELSMKRINIITLDGNTYDLRDQDTIPTDKISNSDEIGAEGSIGEGDEQVPVRKYKNRTYVAFTHDGTVKMLTKLYKKT